MGRLSDKKFLEIEIWFSKSKGASEIKKGLGEHKSGAL